MRPQGPNGTDAFAFCWHGSLLLRIRISGERARLAKRVDRRAARTLSAPIARMQSSW